MLRYYDREDHYEEMRNWAERIKTQVITADGVMKVALFGTQTEVIHIFISVNKLAGWVSTPSSWPACYNRRTRLSIRVKSAPENNSYALWPTVPTRLSMISATRLSLPPADKSSWVTSPSLKRDTWTPGNIMHVNGKRAIGIGISTDPTKDV